MIGGALRAQGAEVAVITPRRASAARPEVLGWLAWEPQRRARLARAVGELAPDVVHVQFAVAAYAARLPLLLGLLDRLRASGLPVVITMHEVTRDLESLGRAGRELYRVVGDRADHIVVHTEPARTAWSALGGRARAPASVIAHHRTELPRGGVGVEQLRGRHGLGEDRIILSFGFIDVDKGLGELVAAAGQLAHAGELSGVRIVVAGTVRRRFGAFRIFELRDRRHLRTVTRRVARLGLGSRVQFVGYVPGEEVRAWFDLATLAVLPYRRSEQSGVASLAAAAGAPLLTTEVGELAAMSTFAPVPARDPTALADALRTVLRAPERRVGARTPGGDVGEIAAQTLAVYRRLTADAPADTAAGRATHDARRRRSA